MFHVWFIHNFTFYNLHSRKHRLWITINFNVDWYIPGNRDVCKERRGRRSWYICSDKIRNKPPADGDFGWYIQHRTHLHQFNNRYCIQCYFLPYVNWARTFSIGHTKNTLTDNLDRVWQGFCVLINFYLKKENSIGEQKYMTHYD